jgi:glutaredoxin
MSDEITIFTKPGCPFCAAAKDDFRRRGVAFTEHNVLADREAQERMLALNGGKRAVPTIVEGGRVRLGFNGS